MPEPMEGEVPVAPKTKRPRQLKRTPAKRTSATSTQRSRARKPNRAEALPEVWADMQPVVTPEFPVVKTKNLDYRWTLLWIGVGLLGILIVSTTAAYFSLQQKRAIELASLQPIPRRPVAPTPEPTALAPLTGLPVSVATAARRAWAVVVENFPSARPQSGLAQADVVFETPTEGGITRFLAIFQSQLPKDKVGPIRSARSYFNDWARPFAAIYSHSGGSSLALKQLKQNPGSLQDANEFYFGAAYTRDTNKNPPHNLFTTAEKFMSYASDHKWSTTGAPKSFTFAAVVPPGQTATLVEIPYSPAEYRVSYNYNAIKAAYERNVGGKLHTGADGATLAATNVILLYTSIVPIPNDALLRTDLTTSGSGQAILYTAGKRFDGKWVKKDADSQITFVDAVGAPLPLQPGNTWISVLDKTLAPKVQIVKPELQP